MNIYRSVAPRSLLLTCANKKINEECTSLKGLGYKNFYASHIHLVHRRRIINHTFRAMKLILSGAFFHSRTKCYRIVFIRYECIMNWVFFQPTFSLFLKYKKYLKICFFLKIFIIKSQLENIKYSRDYTNSRQTGPNFCKYIYIFIFK